MTAVEDIRIAMIVAMASNRVIGRDNQLPWHLPGDLKYFKASTMGKPLLMGRKTFESIGRPLPGRPNLVLSTKPDFSAEGVETFSTIEAALARARQLAAEAGEEELMVIGGGQLYAALLPQAQRLYLTRVEADIEGDAWFPEVDWQQWRELSRDNRPAQGENPYGYSFLLYERK